MKITPYTIDIIEETLQNISLAMIEDRGLRSSLKWEATPAGGEAERLIITGRWGAIGNKGSEVITRTEIPCQDKSIMHTLALMHQELMTAV